MKSGRGDRHIIRDAEGLFIVPRDKPPERPRVAGNQSPSIAPRVLFSQSGPDFSLESDVKVELQPISIEHAVR